MYDPTGNNDGRLDPGESVDLTATLKNIGGYDFTNLSTTIESSDLYVTITDNSGYFGTLFVDGTKENTGDPYVVSASSSAPMGHVAEFILITTEASFVDTFEFELVIGTYDYLVWNPDPTPLPGQNIDSILASLGYTGVYSMSLPADLGVFRTIFGCVGIYPNNYRIDDGSDEANAIVNYITSCGRMYLEGGNVWYFDPLGSGYDFGPLFGINAVADGTGDAGPIVGEPGIFTDSMHFAYAGENAYIDHIDPTGTGFLIFHDDNNLYNCGVANDAGTYRTVGTSFELGLLVDDTPPSTRSELMDRVIQWLGVGSEPDVTPPIINNVEATKNGNNVILTWNTSDKDTLGWPETMSHYGVYRNTSPDFVPDPSDSIGMTAHPDTEYVDSGALLGVQNCYYLVMAVDTAGNKSKKSNMAYAFRKNLNENTTATDKNWTGVPWFSNYATVSDLTDDVSRQVIP